MDLTLAARDVHKRYGRARVLEGVTLEVPRGAIYGFLGRNGAGKTTALRIVMGIVRADSGRIELFGRARDRPSLDDRKKIGSVSQEPTFYPWMTAKELGRFVRGFYPTWDDAEYTRLLAAFDVPHDRRASLLSGGTRAKLGLALALAHRPELLVLDEPTAGLDPVARREFLDLVQERSRSSGATVIFSSHLVDEVERVANIVGILEAGKVRYQGSPQALVDEMRSVAAMPTFATLVARTSTGDRIIARAPAEMWRTVEDARRVSLEDAFLSLVSRAGHNGHSPPFSVARPTTAAPEVAARIDGLHEGEPSRVERPAQPVEEHGDDEPENQGEQHAAQHTEQHAEEHGEQHGGQHGEQHGEQQRDPTAQKPGEAPNKVDP